MDWSKGFSARYRIATVDPVTWADIGFLDFTEGTVTRSLDGLMQSADLTMTEDPGEKWIRIYLDARSDSGGVHTAVFTGLTSAPGEDKHGRRSTFKAECYSVLQPCKDMLMPKGWSAGAEVPVDGIIAGLLRVSPAPFKSEMNAPMLTEPIIAEENETNLTMIHKILDAVGWHLRIAGDGAVMLTAGHDEPAASYSALDVDVVEKDVTRTYDWYSCPNCIRVTQNDSVSEARDDDPNSPLSTRSRGREIWAAESASGIGDAETLDEYAQRRLRELQSPGRAISYTRRYDPEVMPGDAVLLHYPAEHIQGLVRVSKQTITLGKGCRTQEEVEEIESD